MRFTRKIKMTLNTLSLLVAFIFILVAMMMIYNRDALDSLGESSINEYSKRFQKEYDIAISNLKADNIVLVETQLDNWSDILKGDRAYSRKNDLLQAISEKLHQEKQYNKMMRWSKLWSEMDGRNITAKAYYYEALRNLPESHDEGMKGLAAAYENFPINRILVKFYIASLHESGQIEEVKKVISNVRTQQAESIFQKKRWQLFWDMGNGFRGKDSLKSLGLTKIDNEMWAISAVIKGNLKSLRIDPPPGFVIYIADIKLQTEVGLYDISMTDVKLHMMSIDGEWLVTSGGNDPYFSFNVLRYFENINDDNNIIEVRFKVRLATDN